MSQSLAAEARENLALTHDTLEAMHAKALKLFEDSTADDDKARLEAWAMCRAINELRRRLRGPIETLSILEASQKGSTS
jgi:hypothetical protein